MRLIYVIDYCFQETPDGKVWTDTAYSESFWEPYFAVYQEIVLVCRTNFTDHPKAQWQQVNGPRIQVRRVSNYSGALGYLRVRHQIDRQIDEILSEPGMVMVRVPSNLARCAVARLKRLKRAYGVDVVGDPWHAMAPGVTKVRGRALYRWLFTRSQRQVCLGAVGVTYVASILPMLYPANSKSRVLVCSDVRLDHGWIRSSAHSYGKPAHSLITVATLTQMYKGIDVLLRSLAICKAAGLRLSLTIIGTGRHRGLLEEYAKELGIPEQVEFRGAISWGPQLMKELDAADLFVLPSLVEVMPRALLEAMARALPAVATRVGAVAHVLADEDVVEPGDASILAERLMQVCQDTDRLSQMSSRNLATARLYQEDALLPKWMSFHRELCVDCGVYTSTSVNSRPQIHGVLVEEIHKRFGGGVADVSQ